MYKITQNTRKTTQSDLNSIHGTKNIEQPYCNLIAKNIDEHI